MKAPTNYHRIQILVAAALASLAVAVAWSASASAYPITESQFRPAGSATQSTQTRPNGQIAASSQSGPYSGSHPGIGAPVGSSPTQVRVVHATPNPGFNWGDAAIGAGAAVALTMIGLGGLAVVSNRRQRQARPAATA